VFGIFCTFGIVGASLLCVFTGEVFGTSLFTRGKGVIVICKDGFDCVGRHGHGGTDDCWVFYQEIGL